MKLSKRLIVLIVVVLVVAGGVTYLYLPRDRGLTAAVAATLDILNTDISAQKGGGAEFQPALDGDLLAAGDVVRSNESGRAVLTFFDGSSLTIDPGSVVRVITLDHLASGGIRLAVEQTLGRTWASVSKLRTADSKFEVKTPTSTASVRGTAFETIVTRRPDGSVTVTYKADDGTVVVTANAGGQTTLTPNTQVTIATNDQAPAAPAAQAPAPTIRITASSGVGFAATSPTGATCGSAENKAEIPGCLVNGDIVTIRDPHPGRYALMLTSAAAATNATITVEALRGTAVEATQTLSRAFALGDLVRSGFTYGAGTPQTLSTLETAEQITSVCGAQATGRVFSAGTVQERYDLLRAYAAQGSGAPVSLVVTDAELTRAATNALPTGSSVPAQVQGLRISADGAGLHLSAQVVTAVGTFDATGDVIAGPVNGRLVLRVRDLTAGPLPPAILQQIQTAIENGMNDFSASFPITVARVALRTGCLGVMGTTP